jgi:hypothetical protein
MRTRPESAAQGHGSLGDKLDRKLGKSVEKGRSSRSAVAVFGAGHFLSALQHC